MTSTSLDHQSGILPDNLLGKKILEEQFVVQAPTNEEKNFIVVAGNIGSGKTTLTEMIAKRYGMKAMYESVEDNPYLADFYSDMKKWSFPLQVYFLTHRFHFHRLIEQSSAPSIQDRSIYEDAHIFARSLRDQGLMDERDYQNYLNLYHTMLSYLSPPTLLIGLKRSLPKLKERIQLRGRDYESKIDDQYLARLNQYYDDWYQNYQLGKILIVDTDEYDFLNEESHFERLLEKIDHVLEQRQFLFSFD